jgi:hypothetical protein
MSTNVVFVAEYAPMHCRIFLVSHEKQGWLVNYNPHYPAHYDYLCPCCMGEGHHEKIMTAVRTALSAGEIVGKVGWCSVQVYKDYEGTGDRPYVEMTANTRFHIGLQDYGDRLNKKGLDQSLFCAGDPYTIPREAQSKLNDPDLFLTEGVR